jgi:PEP-CTERM motif
MSTHFACHRVRVLAAAFIVALLASSTAAWADDYQTKVVTFAGNLSPWGGVADPINVDKFIGPNWDASLPAIDLSLKACADVPVLGNVCVGYGADGHASTNGKLGFDLGLHASGGSVQVVMPMTLGLHVDPGVRGLSGTLISVPVNNFSLEAGGFNYLSSHGVISVGPPEVRSYAPSFDAHLNADAQLGFSLDGHICYIYCLSGNVDEQPGGIEPLFNIAPVAGGGYSASALGNDVSLPYTVGLGENLGTLEFNVPNVNTDSSNPALQGADGIGYDAAMKTVTSKARDEVFGISLDLTAIVGDAYPILEPFIGNHDFGPIGSYDLLSASLGVFLEYAEKFVASVKDVVVGFVFSDEVSVNNHDASNFYVPDLSSTKDQELFITPGPGVGGIENIGVVPVYYVRTEVHHEPSLVPTLEGELKVLDFSLAGHEFGPLADEQFDIPLGELDLPSFDTVSDYIPIVGMPFNIHPSFSQNALITDPCAIGPCIDHEIRVLRRGCPIVIGPSSCDPTLEPNEMYIVDGSCPESASPFDCPNHLDIGKTSLSAFTDQNLDDLIFTNATSLTFPAGLQGPLLAAGYASNWLSEHGVTNDAPPFPDFPAFQFPFDIPGTVPEPGTFGLAFTGMLAVAFARRRPLERRFFKGSRRSMMAVQLRA